MANFTFCAGSQWSLPQPDPEDHRSHRHFSQELRGSQVDLYQLNNFWIGKSNAKICHTFWSNFVRSWDALTLEQFWKCTSSLLLFIPSVFPHFDGVVRQIIVQNILLLSFASQGIIWQFARTVESITKKPFFKVQKLSKMFANLKTFRSFSKYWRMLFSLWEKSLSPIAVLGLNFCSLSIL